MVTSSSNVDGELVEETKEFTADTKEALDKQIEAYKSAEAKD